MSTDLALFGGEPVRTDPFVVGYDPTTRQNIGEAEVEAVSEVLRSQKLSGFVAGSSEAFFGGEKVRELETVFERRYGVEHAIAVNSWTSGLFAAVAAADLEPGSEVIVPPITMSASASAILDNDCVPVFADVDPETANLDPDAVREAITPETGAIMVVHIFGYPARMDELVEIADEHDLLLIEDAAQGVDSTYDGEFVGTIGDIGGFSLNVHKHVHSGEGGIVVTDDDELAQRVELVRNHGETVVSDLEGSAVGELSFDYTDIVGQNYRMTEPIAAVGVEQMAKLDDLVERRRQSARRLRDALEDSRLVTPTPVRPDSTHSYYGFPMLYDETETEVPLPRFIEAVSAEGVPVDQYVEPLYTLPVYREGNVHENGQVYSGDLSGVDTVDYSGSLCPVAERLYGRRLFITDTIMPDTTPEDVDDIARAIDKVEQNLDAL